MPAVMPAWAAKSWNTGLCLIVQASDSLAWDHNLMAAVFCSNVDWKRTHQRSWRQSQDAPIVDDIGY